MTPEIFLHTFLLVIVNFFLPILLAEFVGKALSFIAEKRKAYALLICAIFIFFFGGFIGINLHYYLGISLYNLQAVFYIFSSDIEVPTDPYFAYSVLPHRFIVIFFWIFLFWLIIYLKDNTVSEIKKSAAAVLSALMVLNFVLTVLPQSKAAYFQSYDYEEPYIYYSIKNADKEFIHPVRNERANFNVTQYDLDIDIYLNFRVKAEMSVDKSDLEQYKFTLYHGYRVSKITDQNGSKLDFVRDSDYITVQNRTFDISRIIIYYANSSLNRTGLANIQAVNLTGDFNYYPRAGWSKVYNGTQFYRLKLDNETQFNVAVHSPLRVYSNLDETARNRFSSKSLSMTLIGGFAETKNINGTEYIYPYLSSADKRLQNIADAAERGIIPKRKKVVVVKGGCYNDYKDYIEIPVFEEIEGLAEKVTRGNMDDDKYDLYQAARSANNYYGQGGEFDFNGKYTTFSYDYNLYKECVRKLGVADFYEKVAVYAFDDADARTTDEFLRDLLENGAESQTQ